MIIICIMQLVDEGLIQLEDKVAKTDWNDSHLLGGYIWHTTGSGKTMTSFKSAQLIAR